MKRILKSALVMAMIACACASTAHEAAPAITVAVQGMQVVKSSPDGDNMLQAFNAYPGTSVALLVTDPGGRLVAFDHVASSVTSFADGNGKDLTKADGESPIPNEVLRGWAFRPLADVTEDGKHCGLEISMPGLPSKQATEISLSGKLVFLAASQKNDFSAESVSLRVGTKVNTGPVPLTIKRVGKPRFGGGTAMEVEFLSDHKFDVITQIRFFDAAGKEIPSREHMRSSGTLPNPFGASCYEATIVYRLERLVDTVKLVITGWTDSKEITVPFDMKVGLGL